jgi:hypothetical protein
MKPDFERFRLAVTREGIPDRIPLAEVGIDIEVMEAFLERPIDSVKTYASFWEKAGYDYALVGVRGQPIYDSFQLKIAEGQLTAHSPEKTVSLYSSARVKDQETFDSYPWIGPEDVYYKDVDLIKDHLADGMKLVVNIGPIFQSLFRIMGVETLSIATIENPGLVRVFLLKSFLKDGDLHLLLINLVSKKDDLFVFVVNIHFRKTLQTSFADSPRKSCCKNSGLNNQFDSRIDNIYII